MKVTGAKTQMFYWAPVILISSGGLGNQLFVSCLAHEIKKRRKYVFVVCSPWNARGQDSFQLSAFCHHKIKYFGGFHNTKSVNLNILINTLNQISGYLIHFISMTANDVVDRFTSSTPDWNHFAFKGCLQRAEIAVNNPEFIREILSFLKTNTEKLQIDPRTICHVRRGDYVGNEYFGVLATQFYLNALLLLEQVTPYVISDDERIGFNIAESVNGLYLNTTEFSPWMLLRVMSESPAVISANSSLSWWGGFLAYSNGGRHLIPTPWLMGTSDEERWLKHSGSEDVRSIFE